MNQQLQTSLLGSHHTRSSKGSSIQKVQFLSMKSPQAELNNKMQGEPIHEHRPQRIVRRGKPNQCSSSHYLCVRSYLYSFITHPFTCVCYNKTSFHLCAPSKHYLTGFPKKKKSFHFMLQTVEKVQTKEQPGNRGYVDRNG